MAEYPSEKKEQYTPVHNGRFQGHNAQHDVRQTIYCIFIGSVLINLILLSAVIVLSVRKQEQPIIRVDSCPDGWIGFQRRCYLFVDVNRNWTSSRRECSSFNASLTAIDSQEEMDFIKRCKGQGHHWIGLQRSQETEPWKWVNGTEFNNWFEVHGGGGCVYMDHNNIISSSCAREKRRICSKPVEYNCTI